MKQNIRIFNGYSSITSSTLLIPEFLLEKFQQKRKKFGSLKAMFHYIVNSKHPVFLRKTMSQEGKIVYQTSGLGLRRINFFPDINDWEKFRTYAGWQRVSMTFLFVLILMNWESFDKESFRVPSIPEKILLITSLTMDEPFTFLEIQHLRL